MSTNDFPPQGGYDEQLAEVSQALGIPPKAWQAGGRTRDFRPVWGKFETEQQARYFVDSAGPLHSHMIMGLPAEPDEAWAIRVVEKLTSCGFEVVVRGHSAGCRVLLRRYQAIPLTCNAETLPLALLGVVALGFQYAGSALSRILKRTQGA